LSFGGICLVMIGAMFAFYFAVLRRPRHRRKA
jgi:preprotein translocase subunit YajC